MKKFGMSLLVLSSLLVLGACGDSGASADSSETIAKLEKTVDSLESENKVLNDKINELTTAGDTKDEIKFSKVGIVEYTVTSLKTEEVENKQDNYTNAEYNFQGINNMPAKYFRTVISYQLKNTADKELDLSTYQATIIDDDNIEYNRSSNDKYLFDENSNDLVQPGTSTTGSFYLISKNAPKITNFKISVSEQSPQDYTQGKIGDAGVAEMIK